MRIIVANAHSGPITEERRHDFADWVRDQGADVTVLSEAAHCLDELQVAGSVYAGAVTIPAREVAVVLHSRATRAHRTLKLTDGLGTRIAPARYVTRVVDLVNGWETVEYSVHAHAGIQDRATGLMHDGPTARDWEAARVKLEAMIRADLDLGRQVIVGGDFNMVNRGNNTTGPMFARLGLTYAQTELLWLAWSPAFTLAGAPARLPNPPGSDHVALRVELTVKEVPSMAARYQLASWEPLGRQTEDRMTAHDIVCIHTMVGSLTGTDSMFERDGYGGTEAHFGVGGAGEKVKQWQDLAFTADANLEGNPRVLSIENADKGPGFPVWSGGNVPAFTGKQLDQLVDLVTWLCSREAHSACPSSWKCHTEGIPAVLVPDSKPGRRGIAYHRQGIKGSLPDMWVTGGEVWSASTGKVCPGDRRVKQVREELVPRVAERLHPTGPTRVTVVREALLEVLNGETARSINPDRLRVLEQLDRIRAAVRDLPER
jgi:hypothetical protein